MRLPSLAVVVFGLAAVAAVTVAQAAGQTAAPTTAPWSYRGRTGPMNWGRLDPSYSACSSGQQQSPVDIRHPRLNPALKPIQFDFLAGPVTLENNGHTVVVHVVPGSYMVAGGVRYDLIQFHFHHPGEEAVKGILSDMDVHFVFRDAAGNLAVIAVQLNAGQDFPNATLETLWAHLPATKGATEKIDDMVDPAGLLPTGRSYWTYMGSLTTPPCTEGVRWFVLQQQLSISRAELNAFASLFPMNARPVQVLRGRRVEASQ